MKDLEMHRPVVMSNTYKVIPDVTALQKIGAGHDGIVYRYGEYVFKILKHNILERKEKDLMTFEKATYLTHNLKLNRITQPIDILLDSDGVYTGYVMKYFEDVTKDKNSPYYQQSGEFLMRDLRRSLDELEEDVDHLSSKKVIIDDLNRGSYIYTKNYLVMCDMDKFHITSSSKTSMSQNSSSLNFFLSKCLFYEMYNSGLFTKEEIKQLLKWVKKSSNDYSFLSMLRKDCMKDANYPIGEYAKEKGKMLVR